MKTYSFAKLQARPYPTLSEIANPYIYGDVRCVINVSGKAYPKEIEAAFRQKGVSFFHYPLREEDGEMDIQNIRMAVMQLDKADREGWRSVVHCDFGNNRSRVVAELFHYYMSTTSLRGTCRQICLYILLFNGPQPMMST